MFLLKHQPALSPRLLDSQHALSGFSGFIVYSVSVSKSTNRDLLLIWLSKLEGRKAFRDFAIDDGAIGRARESFLSSSKKEAGTPIYT
jgi:hypothetical protein